MKKISTSAQTVIFGICTLALTLILIAARVVCTILGFDFETGYYAGICKFVSLYLPLLLVAIAAVFCFIPKLKIKPSPTKNTLAVKLCAVLPAAALALFVFKTVENYMIVHTITKMEIIAIVAAIGGIAFFIMAAFLKDTDNVAYLLGGILAIAFGVAIISNGYLDISTPLNSHLRTINQIGVLAFMLLVLSELRAAFDTKRIAFQLFCVASAVIILGTASIPTLSFYFSGQVSYTYSGAFVDVVLLGAFVFAVARLMQLCFSAKEGPIESQDSPIQSTDNDGQ